MTLSRMHVGMLGIVSIFTGMISPVLRGSGYSFPFPLTELQIAAYIVFICLATLCVFIGMYRWYWVRICGCIIVCVLLYLFFSSWSGEIHSNTGIRLPSLGWGWLFLMMGTIFLMMSMIGIGEIDMKKGSSHLSDTVLGWLAATVIIILTGLIVSISYVPTNERYMRNRVLDLVFGSGNIETHSGVTRSLPYPSIEKLTFNRTQDRLSFFTSSGTHMVSYPDNTLYDRLPYAVSNIGDTTYVVTADQQVLDKSGTIIGKAILPQEMQRGILLYSGSKLMEITSGGVSSMSGSYKDIKNIYVTKDAKHIVWSSDSLSGDVLYKDGIALSGPPHLNISDISTSGDGTSVMAMAYDIDDGGTYILQNGVRVEKIEGGYIAGSLKMNGNERMYAIEREGAVELIHNGSVIDRKFDEIREIFLDTDGSEYVYFGRPLGEKTYCLYTKYRGNICGLEGYMNPRQAPDGSILYAGLKDGAWGIYRNATALITNTGYPNRGDISHDYVFFDVTKPTYYLFIRGDSQGYRIFRKGDWVEGTYEDVGLDVFFGYDNKVIMSAKDDIGWRIIEL